MTSSALVLHKHIIVTTRTHLYVMYNLQEIIIIMMKNVFVLDMSIDSNHSIGDKEDEAHDATGREER